MLAKLGNPLNWQYVLPTCFTAVTPVGKLVCPQTSVVKFARRVVTSLTLVIVRLSVGRV